MFSSLRSFSRSRGLFAPKAFPQFRFSNAPRLLSTGSADPTKITVLKNKLRVATEEIPGETATIGVWIDAGSAYENDQNNGVAHFLEHMAFKGTKNRAKRDIEMEIENMGGMLNAYTSREQTVYYAKVFKNDIPKAVDILSDILLNSKLEESKIESERSTILREMEEVNKDESEVIFDYLHSAAFQGTSLARTILGPEENIKSLKRADLVKYIETHYKAPRMVLAASGAIKHEEVVALAEKAFESLPSDSSNITIGKTPFTGSLVTVRDDNAENCHFAIAVESVPWSHPDYFAFMVLQVIVGNWDRTIGGGKNLSSRLCELIATEKLAHSFNSFNTFFSTTGLFGAQGVAPGDKVEDLVFEIFNEWNRIGKNVTEREVSRAKTKLKASVIMQLDGTTALCEDIGRQLLTHGRRLSIPEILKRIDAITPSDISRIVKKHCEDVSPSVIAMGAVEEFPDYNILRDWTFQRRW